VVWFAVAVYLGLLIAGFIKVGKGPKVKENDAPAQPTPIRGRKEV
jgi:hypothetical protein